MTDDERALERRARDERFIVGVPIGPWADRASGDAMGGLDPHVVVRRGAAMSEAMTRAQVERRLNSACEAVDSVSPALVDLLLDHDAALRQEIERLTADVRLWQGAHVRGCPTICDDDSDAVLADAQQCTCMPLAHRLAQAEHERDRLTAERDAAHKQSEESSLIMALGANQTEHYARQSMVAQDVIRKLTVERDEWKRATSGAQDELYKAQQRLAQAEQERDRLRTALESAIRLIESEYCSHDESHGADTPQCYAQPFYKALRGEAQS